MTVLRAVAVAAARLAAALCLGFVLFQLIPGDPVLAVTAGRPATAAEIALRRSELGLDRPLPTRFADHLDNLVHGRLGTSFGLHRPVADLLLERLGPTLVLVGTATVASIAIGLGTGTVAGWTPGGRFDRVVGAVALVLWATPTVWLGLVLLIGFGAGVGVLPGGLPIGGMRSTPAVPGLVAGTLDVLGHLLLPVLTLVAVQFGQYHLLVRAAVVAEREQAYVVLARAKGFREAQVRRRHVLVNALPAAAAQACVGLGYVLSGAIAVEAVFSWPGLGLLTYQAVRIPDLPVLYGTFLLFSAGVIVANLAGDLIGARSDPRLDPTSQPVR